MTEVAEKTSNDVVTQGHIARRLAGANVSDIEIPSVKVPGSGGTVWEIPGDEATKEIIGTVIDDYSVDSFYIDEFDGGNEPPDALWIGGEFQYANDRAREEGILGGLLADEPLAKFDADLGKTPISGRWRIFLVPDGEFLPLRIEVPVMSRKKWFNFALAKIEGRGRSTTDAVIKLGLEQLTNKGGIKYARIVPEFVRWHDADEAAHFAGVAESFLPLTRRTSTPESVAAVDDSEEIV